MQELHKKFIIEARLRPIAGSASSTAYGRQAVTSYAEYP
jgi:hypothetical protein